MTNAELIAMLQQLPQDLHVRIEGHDKDLDLNFWVIDVEHSNTGDSGYEIEGEIRLIISE